MKANKKAIKELEQLKEARVVVMKNHTLKVDNPVWNFVTSDGRVLGQTYFQDLEKLNNRLANIIEKLK